METMTQCIALRLSSKRRLTVCKKDFSAALEMTIREMPFLKSGEAVTTSLKETILIPYLRSLIGETGSEGSKGSQVSHLS